MKLIQMSDSFATGLEAVNWAKKQTQLTAIGCKFYLRYFAQKSAQWTVYRTVVQRDHEFIMTPRIGKFTDTTRMQWAGQHNMLIDADSSCMTIAEYMKKYHREIQ